VHECVISRMPTSIERSGEEIRFHPTRFYGLDANSELVQLKSHAFAPAFKRPFRRVIDRVERNRQESANRRRIDEQSSSFLSEMWDKRLCCADRPQHVGVDHAENLVVRKPFKRTRKTVASIVEHYIDAAACNDLGRNTLDFMRISDIQRHQCNARTVA